MATLPASLRPEATPSSNMNRNERRSWWTSLFVLCALLGGMLGLSVKTQSRLVRQTANVGAAISNKQIADLQRTIAQYQQKIARYESGATTQNSQMRLVSEDLKSAKFLAGLTSVQGPGVVVTLNDSKKPFPVGLGPGIVPPNIIHDTDINQTVNELKAAGAEAISVNDQRLVATSPVRCAGPTVYVNNTAQTPPYVIKAIGDPKTLNTAVNLSGGIATQIQQFDPAMFKVDSAKHLDLPAFAGATPSRYASSVPAASSAETQKKTGE